MEIFSRIEIAIKIPKIAPANENRESSGLDKYKRRRRRKGILYSKETIMNKQRYTKRDESKQDEEEQEG